MTEAVSIDRVVVAEGVGGNYCEDLAALRSGAVGEDGAFLVGRPVTPGFRSVKEPGEALSVLLVLSDGQVAQGDAVSVVYAGFGGRDPVFRSNDARRAFEGELGDWLRGLEIDSFRALSAELEERFGSGGRSIHTGLRFGVSQALLHAVALARHATIAEVVADEYGPPRRWSAVPILAQSGRDRYAAVDRMILRRVPVIPHGDFTSLAEIGEDGRHLLAYVDWMRDRVAAHGGEGYQPAFQLDLYGTLGLAFDHDPKRIAAFLVDLEHAAGPHPLTVEAPTLGTSRTETIDRMAALRAEVRTRGSAVRVAADEFCNTVEDIAAFADAGAADMIQIKMPDLGSVGRSIEAVRLCHDRGLAAFLGGSCNETDWSSRVTVQVALATEADLIYNKPGFGVDEGHMIVVNEMARTLALLAAR